MPSRARIQTYVEGIALGALAALPLSPYLIHLMRVGVPRFVVEGDYAGLEMAARLAWHGKTLLGPYSRFGFNHPGPLYFYLLAPVVALGGKSSTGLYAGACVINGVAAALSVFALRVCSTRAHAVAATFVLSAWLAAFGNACALPWNPIVVVLPMIALLVLAAMLACGTSWAAPCGALCAAFVVETHIATIPTAAGVTLVALVVFAIVVRRRKGFAAAERGHLTVAGGLLLLAALPPLVEQVRSREGNLTKLVHFISHPPAPPKAFGLALSEWTYATSWLPDRLFGRTLSTEGPGPRVMASEAVPDVPSRFAIAILVAWLAAVLAASVIAIRRRDERSAALLGIGVLASMISALSLRAAVGPSFYYLMFWTTAGSTIGWMGVATTLTNVVAETLHSVRPKLARRIFAAGAVLAMAAVLATTSLQKTWLAKNGLARAPYPGLEDIERALLARIRTTAETPIVHPAGAWHIGTALILELTKDGVAPRVPIRDRWILGRGLAAPDGALQPLHVYPGTREQPLNLALELGVSPTEVRECEPGRVGFGRGFYPREVGLDGHSWRWMTNRGEVRMRNEASSDGKLRVAGSVPIEFMPSLPTIRITLENHLIDSFVPTRREFSKEYAVSPELLDSAPWVLLVVETNRVVHAPGDPRDLGVLIDELSFHRDRPPGE
jgi:hypothetical protein